MKKRGRYETLPPEAVAYLRRSGEEIPFADSEVIVRRGDPGKAFYVVLSGTVEVRLTVEGNCRLPLVRLDEGAFFGEMSILTDQEVSADVVALGPVEVLRYPAELFSKALSESDPLRTHIMAGLAANLQRTTTDAWNFFQRAEALNVLMDSSAEPGALIAQSRSMAKVLENVESSAPGEESLLVSGESGTGKTFIASHIHVRSGKKGRPFIVVDCRSLSEEEAVIFLFGSTWSRREGGADPGFGSLQNYGALHLANEGTLVLRHIEALGPEARETLARYGEGRREGRVHYPRTRLIATTAGGADGTQAASCLTPDLAAVFSSREIALPPLRKRRKDIIPLAHLFLEEHRKKEGQSFTLAAEHTLLSRKYTHGNAAELREAVEMAALVADGSLLEPEHIFTGPKDQGGLYEYELEQLPLFRRMTSPSVLKIARGAVFASFAAVILLSLFSSRTPAGRTANAVTWSLWEPALLLLFLFVGRVWCTVCPLSTAGKIARRFKSLERQPDEWLKKYTGWFIIAGFIAVIWSEHTFHMVENPFASSLLLLSLMAAAVAFAVVYQRETWCRYACPLGNLGAVYALPAVLNIRANPSVCATYCTTHECYKGSKDLPGCPVFHHPLYARDAHHCKQCCTCLQVCPHNSAKLYLRLPLQGIWRQGDLGTGLLPFAVFLFFFSPFMLASQGAGWASSLGGFTANTALAIIATLIFLPHLPRLLAPDPDPDPLLSSRVAFSLLILAWGPAMAYQLNHIHSLSLLRIHAEEGSAAAGFLPSGEVTVQAALQVGVILLAGALTVLCLLGIKWRSPHYGSRIARGGWWLLSLLCTVYILACLTLVLPEGVFFG